MLKAILAGLALAAKAAAVGIQVAPYLTRLHAIASQGREPTDAERAELDAMEAALDAELQAAQPEAQ